MKKYIVYKYGLVAFCCTLVSGFLGNLNAETFPRQGARLQDKASEKIEFIVMESTSKLIESDDENVFENDVEVVLKVKVTNVTKTTSELKKNQVIEIRYKVISWFKSSIGSWPKVLPAGQKSVGYLNQKKGNHYVPAARSYSFVRSKMRNFQ